MIILSKPLCCFVLGTSQKHPVAYCSACASGVQSQNQKRKMSNIFKLVSFTLLIFNNLYLYGQNKKLEVEIVNNDESKAKQILLSQSLLSEMLSYNYLIRENEIIDVYKSFNYLKLNILDSFFISSKEKILFYRVIIDSPYNHYIDSINLVNKLSKNKFNLGDIKYFYSKNTIIFAVDFSYGYANFYRIKGFLNSDKAILSISIVDKDLPFSIKSKIHLLIKKLN